MRKFTSVHEKHKKHRFEYFRKKIEEKLKTIQKSEKS